MLARRFTIVCLVTMLFGMGFATLVSQTNRPARSGFDTGSSICRFACPDFSRR